MFPTSTLVLILLVALPSTMADEFYKRTPLGTMRFGKRSSAMENFLLTEQLFGRKRADGSSERSIRAPLGTMRFGKRSMDVEDPTLAGNSYLIRK
ncbi:unnamed protein product [Auanema sp. JU1783]|nr:unnamed protein product [Auanema sp. JU1783]